LCHRLYGCLVCGRNVPLFQASVFSKLLIQPDGPETFCLQFSLPFYVWRSSKRHSVDPRTRKSNGKRLRVSREMTSLEMFAHNRLDTSDIDVIYQSHISCIVTGYDQRHWTAILAVDHWFEQELDDAEFSMPDSLERYQDDIDCGLRTDPLSRGQDDAEISRWTPRPYFLRIMGIRLTQVIKEWEGLMYHIEKILQGFAERQKDLQNQEQFLNGACRGISANGSEENTFLAKVLEFRGIVSDINDALRKTIRSGDSFLESDIFWFYPGQEPMSDDNDCQSQLVQIRRLLQGVRRLGEQFRDMEIALQNMSQDAEKLREKRISHVP
ncbi:transcription factor SEF1, partial [Colletotrichum tofieldiae]